MRVLIITILLLALLACGSDVEVPREQGNTVESGAITVESYTELNQWYGVTRFHDDEMNVTCWYIYGTGLNCLPDNQLAR